MCTSNVERLHTHDSKMTTRGRIAARTTATQNGTRSCTAYVCWMDKSFTLNSRLNPGALSMRAKTRKSSIVAPQSGPSQREARVGRQPLMRSAKTITLQIGREHHRRGPVAAGSLAKAIENGRHGENEQA